MELIKFLTLINHILFGYNYGTKNGCHLNFDLLRYGQTVVFKKDKKFIAISAGYWR